MQYMGGKSKIARRLSEAILNNSESRQFYLEPFVGSAAVFVQMAPHFSWSVAGDAQPDLVMMWNALLFEGWEPPAEMPEERWRELRDAEPSPDRAFAGFDCSFAGRFFEGYARDRTGRIDFADKGRRGLLKVRESLTSSALGRFRNWHYDQWNPVPGTVIYCDPPYAGTKRYSSKRAGVPAFDHAHFWSKCREWASAGCEVFVSEYNAPDDIECIWSVEKLQTTKRPEQGRDVAVERLFKVVA